MKRCCFSALAILLAFTLLAAPLNSTAVLAASQPPPESETIDPSLQQAFQARVSDSGEKVLSFLLYDIRIVKVQYSPDGSLALLWLGMFDPETGEAIPGEPGLAIANLSETEVGAKAWMVTLQADSDWQSALDQVPVDLLSEDVRQPYTTTGEKTENGIETTFSGYKLPWAASVTGTLTQSISHDSTSCTSGLCHYAFDFSRVGGVANWSILASKGGTVKMVKTSIPTRNSGDCPGDNTTGNYIVLEDKSTSPLLIRFTCTWRPTASHPACEPSARLSTRAIFSARWITPGRAVVAICTSRCKPAPAPTSPIRWTSLLTT